MEKLLELWHTTLGKVIACLLAIALAFMGWNIAMIMGAFGSDDNKTAATEDVATQGDDSSTPESADESSKADESDAAENASAAVSADGEGASEKETPSASAAVGADEAAVLKIPANIKAYDRDGNELEGAVKVDPSKKQTIYVAASGAGEQVSEVVVDGATKDLVDEGDKVPAAASDAAGDGVVLVPVEIPAASLEPGETIKIDATTEETPADENAGEEGNKAQDPETDKDSAVVDGDEGKDTAEGSDEAADAPEDSGKAEAKDEAKAEQPKVDNKGVVAKGVDAPAFEGYAYVTKGAVFGIFGGTQVTVKVSAGEGVVPEGTVVEATLIDPSEYAELLEDAGLESAAATLVDINLVYEGSYIQPNGAVNVSIFDPDVALPAEGGELQVVHIADTSTDHEAVDASQIINPAGDTESGDETATGEDAAADEPAASELEAIIVETRQADETCVSFDTEHFSIYAIAGSTLLKAGTVNCVMANDTAAGSADLYVGSAQETSYMVKNLANGYEASGLQVKREGAWVDVDNVWNDNGVIVYADGSIASTSDVRIVVKKVKYVTFDVDVQNADLQLVPVRVGNKPSTGNASVASGSWSDRIDASGSKTFTVEDGTVFLFFVKGTDTHLVTGVNPQGNGTESRIFDIDEVKDWDGTDAIRAAAKADGYVAYFGYTRYLTDNTGTNQTISVTVKGTAPSLDMSAKVISDKDKLAPGDKIDIELEVKPQLSVNGYTFTIDDPVITDLAVGSKRLDLSKVNLVKKNDTTYVATIKDYVVTADDCMGASAITVKASASTVYHYSFKAGTGSQTAQVSSAVAIDSSAQASVAIKPAAGVYYDYEFDYDQNPSASAAIPAKPANPGTVYGSIDVVNAPEIGTRVHDDELHGTWVFNGWKKDDTLVGGATLTIADNSTVYIIGHWSFTPDYVVKWINGDSLVATQYYWDDADHNFLVVPADPSKDADAENTYAFVGWADGSGNAAPAAGTEVTGDATYYAQFSASYMPLLTIKYVDENGVAMEGIDTYTKRFHADEDYSVASPPVKDYDASPWVVAGTMGTADVEETVVYSHKKPVNVQHILTVRYVYADGSKAAETHTETLDEGKEFTVTSPLIEGYDADRPVVAGTMGSGDYEAVVTYRAKTPVAIARTLTIHYVYTDGSKAADDHVETLKKGDPFDVSSPVKDGYKPSFTKIGGTMPDHDVELTVVYTAVPVNPDPGVTPGGSTTDPGTNPGGSTDNPGTTDPGTDNPGTTDPGTDNPGTNPGGDSPGGGADNPGDNPGSGDGGNESGGNNAGDSGNAGVDNNGAGESGNAVTPSRPGTTAIVVPGGTSNPVYPIVQALGAPVTVGDNPNPLAGGATNDEGDVTFIDEDGNALMTVDSCWVHFYMIIGLILTVLYGLGVIGRRRAYAGSINKLVDGVVNKKNER